MESCQGKQTPLSLHAVKQANSPNILGSILKDSVNFENKVAEIPHTGLWDVCRKRSSNIQTPNCFCLMLSLDQHCLGCLVWCDGADHKHSLIIITKLFVGQCRGFQVILLNSSEPASAESQDRAWSTCLVSPFQNLTRLRSHSNQGNGRPITKPHCNESRWPGQSGSCRAEAAVTSVQPGRRCGADANTQGYSSQTNMGDSLSLPGLHSAPGE